MMIIGWQTGKGHSRASSRAPSRAQASTPRGRRLFGRPEGVGGRVDGQTSTQATRNRFTRHRQTSGVVCQTHGRKQTVDYHSYTTMTARNTPSSVRCVIRPRSEAGFGAMALDSSRAGRTRARSGTTATVTDPSRRLRCRADLCSFVRSFVRSFVHSFTRSLTRSSFLCLCCYPPITKSKSGDWPAWPLGVCRCPSLPPCGHHTRTPVG